MKIGIKYNPEKTFSVAADGFFGEFYRAPGSRFEGKSIIIFGGSMGAFAVTRMVANKFMDAGLSTMVLAYHGAKGLPKDLKDQPVDVVGKAAVWLKNHGYQKVGVWGISMGGALALVAGSLMPELLSCVVAVAPMEMVTQAELKDDKGLLEGSIFSWHGKPLPYAKYTTEDSKEWSKLYHDESRKYGEPHFRDMLEAAYEANTNEEALIKVWNTGGPILFLGGKTIPCARTQRPLPAWKSASRSIISHTQ